MAASLEITQAPVSSATERRGRSPQPGKPARASGWKALEASHGMPVELALLARRGRQVAALAAALVSPQDGSSNSQANPVSARPNSMTARNPGPAVFRRSVRSA